MADNLSKYLNLERRVASPGNHFIRVVQAVDVVEVEETLFPSAITFGYNDEGIPQAVFVDTKVGDIWVENLRFIEWLRAICERSRSDPKFRADYGVSKVLRKQPPEAKS